MRRMELGNDRFGILQATRTEFPNAGGDESGDFHACRHKTKVG
jgi:hypothetical protein